MAKVSREFVTGKLKLLNKLALFSSTRGKLTVERILGGEEHKHQLQFGGPLSDHTSLHDGLELLCNCLINNTSKVLALAPVAFSACPPTHSGHLLLHLLFLLGRSFPLLQLPLVHHLRCCLRSTVKWFQRKEDREVKTETRITRKRESKHTDIVLNVLNIGRRTSPAQT